MTGKELQKLKREELLQLLLEQSREIARLQTVRDDKDGELLRLGQNNDRRQAKLEEKEVLIRKLEKRRSHKDDRIRSLTAEMAKWRAERKAELEQAGSVAGAALRLNGILKAAQLAADQYLYNIRLRCMGEARMEPDDIGRSGK